MRRPRRGGVAALAVIPLSLLALFGYFIATFEGPLLPGDVAPPAPAPAIRLSDADTQRLGWDPRGLDAAFGYTAGLSSDTLMIVTEGETVAAFGDLEKPRHLHSIRKAVLSALVGQHAGTGGQQIPLTATLAELGIDDRPQPLTALQSQATVLHLLKSLSGINHAAAAEEGLLAEKKRRLGEGENPPGTIWAYNNWDTNALTTIFEARTGLSVAEAFATGIAEPLGLRDHRAGAITYIAAPALSQHRAAMFHMSARDLARFGALYLNKGVVDGTQVLPAAWIERIAVDFTETGNAGLRQGHGYLWWVPGPGTDLPKGTFWAWGFGQQALFVVPEWRSVIVHQADTDELLKRFFSLVRDKKLNPETAIGQLAFSCLEPNDGSIEFCAEHRLILRREFAELISLIAAARLGQEESQSSSAAWRTRE
ncbi:serine hydrolase [Pelagibius litoralis]|uniref:Serine hydrolase n=1 Tax=Pelagibius litoralis TaxID=374515 RepID=A0A967EV15_9PROT|nr:serine hydrolase [Pelagibius litoralis]NIA68016.1 serine hydrolase [Pelagibius litoralis]